MKKKIFSILLALCIAVSLPVSVMADTGATENVIDTEAELVSAIANGGTVETTSSNPDYSAIYTMDNGKAVISGGSIKSANNYAIISGNGTNAKGSVEISGGTFIGANGNDVKKWDNSTLVITGGIFSSQNAESYLSTEKEYVLIENKTAVEGTTMYEVHVHTWMDATCTTPKTCETCGATDGEAPGHDMKPTSTSAPTCTEDGNTEYKCSRCTYTEQKDITAAKGHDWKDATCTTAKTCKTCGATYTEKIDKLPAPVEPTPAPEGLTTLADGSIVYYENGTLVTDKWVLVDTTWYYLDESGAMATGWNYINNTWYYMDASGAWVQ